MAGNKQFLKNLGINGANFLVKMMIGLFLPPFLISHFGLSSFGIIQVAISTGAYASFLSTSLNQANNRFVSIGIVQKDYKETSKVLTTIFILYLLAFLIIVPCILYISFNLTSFFDVDPGLANSATYMFFFVAASQIFVMFNTALSGPLYAKNRIDVIQGINILRNALKLLFVYVFILFISKSLIYVGAAFFIAAIISTLIAFVVFKKYTPFYRFSFGDFDKVKLKGIFGLSVWTGISVIGGMIFSQTDIILVNILLGAEESGEYAILVQWSILLLSVSSILSGVIAPNILIEYAQNDIRELKNVLYSSIKFQGVFSALPATIIVVYADVILNLWVGEEFVHLAPFLQIMVIHLGVSFAFRQIFTVNTAYNKMRFQGIITVICGGIHVLITIILLKYTKLGILGVILSNASIFFILNAIILPIYVISYLKEPLMKLYTKVIPSIITSMLIFVIGYTMKYFFRPDNWTSLFGSLFSTLLVVVVIIFFLLFNREERVKVLDVFNRIGKR